MYGSTPTPKWYKIVADTPNLIRTVSGSGWYTVTSQWGSTDLSNQRNATGNWHSGHSCQYWVTAKKGRTFSLSCSHPSFDRPMLLLDLGSLFTTFSCGALTSKLPCMMPCKVEAHELINQVTNSTFTVRLELIHSSTVYTKCHFQFMLQIWRRAPVTWCLWVNWLLQSWSKVQYVVHLENLLHFHPPPPFIVRWWKQPKLKIHPPASPTCVSSHSIVISLLASINIPFLIWANQVWLSKF